MSDRKLCERCGEMPGRVDYYTRYYERDRRVISQLTTTIAMQHAKILELEFEIERIESRHQSKIQRQSKQLRVLERKLIAYGKEPYAPKEA